MSSDKPHFDEQLNCGTTAPNCQPRHTKESLEQEALAGRREAEMGVAFGEADLEIVLSQDAKDLEVEVVPDTAQAQQRERTRREKEAALGRKNSAASDDGTGAGGATNKMGYVSMAKAGYQELVNAIIRPPRADYKVENLGPPAFTFCGKRFTRTDFTLLTKRGLNLECSHWEPVERTSDRIPVVIYMHGNSSARVEVIPQLSYLLSLGLAVFAFDFAGSGKSDGDHVSLGFYEREDLMCVIAHLRATNVVSTIALWGRSMGAATALMHGDRDPSIACMIMDSSFADLTRLCEELVEKGKEQGIHVPNLVTQLAIRLLQSSVKKQANFNIRDISPISHADKCFIPALFVAGEHDDFINKKHSQDIHDRYVGDKNIIIVDGDHNSPRPKFMFDSASIFLQTCLQIPKSWSLNVHPGMNLMAPPWYFSAPPIKRSSAARRSASSAATKRAQQELNVEDMGMTAERQQEIQSSLFKMLGQGEVEVPLSGSAIKKRNGVSSDQSIGDASNRSRICSTNSVNHSKTFPPGADADSRKECYDDETIDDVSEWGDKATQNYSDNAPPAMTSASMGSPDSQK